MFEGKGGSIRIPKTAEVLASRIRKSIIRGELRAGDKLPPEANLMLEFEVSRPTIREAIRILESEGLITVVRGARGGAKVSAPSPDIVTRAAGIALQTQGATLKDIYEARTLLEPPAARLAAENRSKLAAAALRRHLDFERETIAAPVLRGKAVADFHRILLDECGNVSLAVLGRALQGVVELHMQTRYRSGYPEGKGQSERAVRLGFRSHERLIELIEAEDGPGAEQHWLAHMQAAGEFWLADVGRTSVVDLLD